jgi:hypothetical protein
MISARCRAESTRRYAGLILTVVCCWMLPVSLSADQQGGPVGNRWGQQTGQGGSVSVTKAPPAKVTLMRIVDSSGNVAYEMLKDAKAIERRSQALTEAYEQAMAWRERTAKSFEAKGLKNEKESPVPPVVEAVKTDIAKTDANAAVRSAKDWAVYEIVLAGRTKHVVAYAYSDAFANSLADAEFAKDYNQWVKAGKPEGQDPKPCTVNKITEALTKPQAQQKALTGRMTTAQPAAKPAGGG